MTANFNPDHSKPIEFVDPETGEFYKVKPTKATVDAAWKCGFLPFTAEDHERADEIDQLAADETQAERNHDA